MRFVPIALVVALTVLAGGCGTEGLPSESANVTRGKELFRSAEGQCGACHTLADAGTRGTAGPNLDDAFAGARKDGFANSSIAAVVLDQIHYPTSGSGMPKDLVTGEDAEAVAAYVAEVAGDPEKVKAASAGGGTGKEIFASLCQSCHSLSGVAGTGPALNGIFGKPRPLEGGETVKATNDYLRESIRTPDKQIVKGYEPGVMSAVIRPGQTSAEDTRKLIEFIKARR